MTKRQFLASKKYRKVSIFSSSSKLIDRTCGCTVQFLHCKWSCTFRVSCEFVSIVVVESEKWIQVKAAISCAVFLFFLFVSLLFNTKRSSGGTLKRRNSSYHFLLPSVASQPTDWPSVDVESKADERKMIMKSLYEYFYYSYQLVQCYCCFDSLYFHCLLTDFMQMRHWNFMFNLLIIVGCAFACRMPLSP